LVRFVFDLGTVNLQEVFGSAKTYFTMLHMAYVLPKIKGYIRHSQISGASMMIIYGLANCDQCRSARRMLQDSGHKYVFVDVRADGLREELLLLLLEVFGDALVNRRSTTWRNLDTNDKELAASDLIRKFPTVMKRPVFETNGKFYLGWGSEVRHRLLGPEVPPT